MADHAWCRDVARDAAVRAAEDGRTGPLPTLEECIERQKQTARPCGGTDPAPSRGERGAADTGMRTERITLELIGWAHGVPSSGVMSDCLKSCGLLAIDKPSYVRVVDTHAEAVAESVAWEGARDAYRGRILRLTEERDAAIREREELRKSWLRSEESGTRLLAERNAALDAADGLREQVAELKDKSHARWVSMNKFLGELAETRLERDEAKARVAELEAASGGGYVGDGVVLECDDCGKRFWFDDTSGGSHRMIEPDNAFGGEVWESFCPACNTQAASGGEGEPVAWMVEWTDHAELYGSKTQAERAAAGDVVPQPLFRSPPQPRGWLTASDRQELEEIVVCLEDDKWRHSAAFVRSLLARNAPPKVRLPTEPMSLDKAFAERGWEKAIEAVRAALAAAGVEVADA